MRIRLFGGLDVDGIPAHDIGSRKARTLLKALAVARGHRVTIDALTEILWPGALPAHPAEQVQVLVSRLRATLGSECITRTDAGYALHYAWLDVDELEARTTEAANRLAAGGITGARAAAAAAVHLAAGPFLPDEDGEWAEQARRVVERTVARARLIGAEAALSAGDAAGAAELAAAALDHDPYDERALRAVMAAHAHAGRPASALAVYASCRERLAEDLGVSPTAETEHLHAAILRGEWVAGEIPPPSEQAGAGRSPTGAATFAGRAAVLAALDGELAEATHGGSRVVTVEGDPGIGKTAVVSRWAATVAESAVVLVARCDELGRELPLQPVLDALTDHLRACDPARAESIVGSAAPVVDPLLGFDGSAAPPPDRSALAGLDAAAGQIRLFAALVDVVRRAGAHRPVVLLLDDVHLADASTLSWVAFAVRRMAHLLVVTTRRSDRPRAGSAGIELGGSTIELAPLDLAAVAELVGAERAETLHRRSGGNPLFLLELANSPAGELPPTIVDAVRRRIDALGNAGATIRTAAVLGADVDVDVLAACTDRPLGEVLDELEEAARVRLLVDRGEGFVFAHELVREAIAADVTAARRAMVHREAARALGRRAEGRPLDTAFHARLGGAGAAAAAALIDAARLAADRFDVEAAEQLLDQAIELDDSPPARFARARVRMARSDHAGAAIDVSYAIGPDATADVFELAGWIAYYRRDHVLALRYADEAVHRADSGEVRASALALAGRIRHSRGQLQEAATRLEEAVALAPAGGSGLADFWLASLRVHQGRLAEATAPVWVDDEPRSHPFAVLHAWFARGLAHGLAGRLDAAAEALTGLERAMNGLGLQGRRFAPVAMNMAAWLLRATGREQEADERNAAALELSNGTAFEEPRGHALLDLAEGRRRAGDLAAAAARVDEAAAALTADGTMAWHVRQRVLWMRGRIALESGEFDRAADLAAELIGDADERGSPRYAVLGRHLAALAEPSALTSPAVDALVPRIDEHAGIDAWWLVPELIAAAGGDGTSAGQARAESLVASTAADVDREAMGRWLDQRLLRVASGRGVSRSSR